MSLKERLKKWTLEFAEEGAAETITELAIDQLPPARILAAFTYVFLLASLLMGTAGWYFDSYETLLFVISGITGFIAVILYLVRMYVVSMLSGWLLKRYRNAKEYARSKSKKETTVADEKGPDKFA